MWDRDFIIIIILIFNRKNETGKEKFAKNSILVGEAQGSRTRDPSVSLGLQHMWRTDEAYKGYWMFLLAVPDLCDMSQSHQASSARGANEVGSTVIAK